jgi:hypothetical protein
LPLPNTTDANLVDGRSRSSKDPKDTIDTLTKRVKESLQPIEDVMTSSSFQGIPSTYQQLDHLASSVGPTYFIVNSSNAFLAYGNDHLEINNMTKTANFGDNASFGRDFVQANDITGSFNVKVAESRERIQRLQSEPDLKQLLLSLSAQVEALATVLPEERAGEAADDLMLLNNELSRRQPRKDWVSKAVDSLKSAATIAGTVGEPLLNTINKILGLF